MAVRLEKTLHENHASNSRSVDERVLILQGDYGIGDPELDQIESVIRKVDAETPIQGNKRVMFLFSSLGTIEYALEMSGYSKAEIAEFFKDRRSLPQCFVAKNALYIACYDIDLEKLETELKAIL